MIQYWLNWKSLIALIALFIISGTIFYSNYLANKIKQEEQIKIEQWAEAVKSNASNLITDTNLSSRILAENSQDIPIIVVTEKGVLLDSRNLDSIQLKNPAYLHKKINTFKALHTPIEWKNPLDSTQKNIVYYGESHLLNEVRYYPIVQLMIVGLFLIFLIVAQRTAYQNNQNQLWIGMAKETAHQLGTPVSSLQGWIEMLKEIPGTDKIVNEIDKDANRLLLITDRFGKIGSIPALEPTDLVLKIEQMVDYIKKRSGKQIQFEMIISEAPAITHISPALFDWAIENLLKNALDAMEGKGKITIQLKTAHEQVLIDVSDTGKGISRKNLPAVFKPGFTTKKRGWGLGLTLTKRIIEQYHQGKIFVLNSQPGKGTTFRIVLPKHTGTCII
ncbi:MAG: sensor histidine kinase [Hydrotalea flava]|uniref:sensor histidine kinase n=1 Tax=Hydrotalea TaxID=1004300 RepID=UPI000941EED6|nr:MULTISPECIES: HAMP domain-containing sensor histidine kinase [Hydrotalea]MBY0347214.1 HAMP domain-containing histidine kinase [Hydrotalea flava]NIM34910.1 sensor histidine kinase [Hydrotalea flava]NIM37740.1 sensor histidine kinase [Hydrotalea flava]NIN02905.1 sensor histidine kinase [Hydrotalea flava]NIN14590.1 sensor histidine kinase [Hydrotalea flava]